MIHSRKVRFVLRVTVKSQYLRLIPEEWPLLSHNRRHLTLQDSLKKEGMGVPGFPNVITISDCGKIHFRYTSLFYIKICFRMGPALKSVAATLTGAPRGSPGFAGMTQVRVEQQAALHKEPACQCRGRQRLGFDPWGGKISWSGKRQPTPVFLPGESHGRRSLAGYSP